MRLRSWSQLGSGGRAEFTGRQQRRCIEAAPAGCAPATPLVGATPNPSSLRPSCCWRQVKHWKEGGHKTECAELAAAAAAKRSGR